MKEILVFYLVLSILLLLFTAKPIYESMTCGHDIECVADGLIDCDSLPIQDKNLREYNCEQLRECCGVVVNNRKKN